MLIFFEKSENSFQIEQPKKSGHEKQYRVNVDDGVRYSSTIDRIIGRVLIETVDMIVI